MNGLLKEQVEIKLEGIAADILNFDFENFQKANLLGGIAGIVPFLFDYAKYSKDNRFEELGIKCIHKCVDRFNNQGIDASFSSGISGIAWAFEYLSQNNHLDRLEILDPLENSMAEFMVTEFQNQNWDALHGGIGISHYLIYRLQNPIIRKAFENSIDLIETQSIKDKHGLKWLTINAVNNESYYNFGLAHGMPSIIYFLSNCYEKGIKQEKCKSLLIQLTNYILAQKLEPTKKGNLYPKHIENGEISLLPRLGWCYGDMGIALAFIKANKVIGQLDDEINNLVSRFNSRIDLEENRVFDAGVCHGSAGLMHILNYLKHATKENAVEEKTIDYWTKITLDFGSYKDGFGGFKTMDYDENEKPYYRKEIGFLNGASGIAHALLSRLTLDFRWGEALMIYN